MSKLIYIQPGTSIYQAAIQAQKKAFEIYEEIEFDFNGISMRVTPTSNPDDITLIYNLKCELRRFKNVGNL